MDKLDPRRAKLLIEHADPRCTLSRILSDDPIFEMP
jgi:hypothetical protein